MSVRARLHLALGLATVVLVILCGPAGFDLFGHGWLNFAATVGAALALAAGAWPWYQEQRAEARERAPQLAWQAGMDELARAAGYLDEAHAAMRQAALHARAAEEEVSTDAE